MVSIHDISFYGIYTWAMFHTCVPLYLGSVNHLGSKKPLQRMHRNPSPFCVSRATASPHGMTYNASDSSSPETRHAKMDHQWTNGVKNH